MSQIPTITFDILYCTPPHIWSCREKNTPLWGAVAAWWGGNSEKFFKKRAGNPGNTWRGKFTFVRFCKAVLEKAEKRKNQIIPVPNCSLRSNYPYQTWWNGFLVVLGTLNWIIGKAFFQSTLRCICSLRLITVSGTNVLLTTLNYHNSLAINCFVRFQLIFEQACVGVRVGIVGRGGGLGGVGFRWERLGGGVWVGGPGGVGGVWVGRGREISGAGVRRFRRAWWSGYIGGIGGDWWG